MPKKRPPSARHSGGPFPLQARVSTGKKGIPTSEHTELWYRRRSIRFRTLVLIEQWAAKREDQARPHATPTSSASRYCIDLSKCCENRAGLRGPFLSLLLVLDDSSGLAQRTLPKVR